MKIPTTVPGGAPYYHGPPMNGMEMNPQWQGNGVMVDGAASGNGAAYMISQHVHPAGYGAPAGYYGPGASPPGPPAGPATPQDFSEYMWMENEEEFDKQVMQQLEEEALMEQCIEAMLADEREAQQRGPNDESIEEQISKSTLNPLAAEFVPTFGPATAASSSSDGECSEIPSVSATGQRKESTSTVSTEVVEPALRELSVSKDSAEPTKDIKDLTEESSAIESEETSKPTMADIVAKKSADAEGKKKTEAVVVSATKESISKTKSEEVRERKSKESLPKDEAKGKSDKKNVERKDSKNTDRKKEEPGKSANAPVKQKSETIAAGKAKPVESSTKSVGKGKAPAGESQKQQAAAAEKKAPVKAKEEPPAVVVDLQGPPLPVSNAGPAAVAAAPVEPEKPAAPAVFNYAAAARANLPPKQQTAPAAPAATQPPAAPAAPKEAPRHDSQPRDKPAAPRNQSAAGKPKQDVTTGKSSGQSQNARTSGASASAGNASSGGRKGKK